MQEGHPLQASARGWQQLQIGVLGFVGLCGLFSGDASASRPPWVQDASGIIALTGLVAALIAVIVVASVAHPFTTMTAVGAARRLRSGIIVTFVAVSLTALAALSWWWPQQHADVATPVPRVAVATGTGTACGDLVESGSGAVILQTDGKRVRVPLSRLSSIEVVDQC